MFFFSIYFSLLKYQKALKTFYKLPLNINFILKKEKKENICQVSFSQLINKLIMEQAKHLWIINKNI